MPSRRHQAIIAFLFSLTCWMPGVAPAVRAAPLPARPQGMMLELAAPPVAAVYAEQAATVGAAAATAAAQAQLAALLATQQAVQRELATRQVPVLFSLQRVYNGIAVLASPAESAALAALPGVVAVHPLLAKTPDYIDPLAQLGAPALWTAGPGGFRGEGLRLAIVDTGIDYLHTHFGGPGNGYTQNNWQIVGDVPGYPGGRVVGGYDFVGDTYNADSNAVSYQPIPEPDPDPMDCYGHGTHVAGTAAGSGVTVAGDTYAGPYAPDAPLDTLAIVPGVAPRAALYALKIFGCAGSSDFTDLALEWTVDPNGDGDFSDRMDVVNLSLGSPYGSGYDTTAVAADHAAAAGVIVVASAGNNGDNYFIVGAPSSAARAISVAATQHFVQSAHPATFTTDLMPTFTSRGPQRGGTVLKPDLAAPGVGILSAASGSGQGSRTLSGTSMAAPHVAGAMVLLRQLHPTWSVETLKALAMNTAMPLVRTGDPLTATLYSPARTGAGRIDLARAAAATVVVMGAEAPGQVSISFGAPEVRDRLVAVRTVQIANLGALTATYQLSYTAVADMPGVAVTVEPPTVTLPPGSTTTAALFLHAEAGAMRHLRDATVTSHFSVAEAWLAEESGHLWLWPTAGFTATLHAPGLTGRAELTFAPAISHLDVAIHLDGPAPADVAGAALAAGRPGEAGLVLHTLAALPVATGAGSQLTGTVTLTPQEALLLASGMIQVQVTLAAGGAVVAGQGEAVSPPLHLPAYAAPRPVAALAAAPRTLTFTPEQLIQEVTFTGAGLAGSTPPTDVLSLVTPLALHLQSPNRAPADLAEGELDRYDHADLKYVGASVGVDTQTPPAEPMLFLGVATYAPWSTPNEVEFNLYLDTDEDGSDDYRLYNGDVVHAPSSSYYSDAFVSVLEELATGRKTVQRPLNNMPAGHFEPRLFFSSVMVLPVKLGALKLAGGRLAYRVESFSADRPGRVDVTPMLHVDVGMPALQTRHGQPTTPFLAVVPGATITATLDLPAYAALPAQRLLLLHHQNRAEAQAEVVEAQVAWPAVLALPWVGKE